MASSTVLLGEGLELRGLEGRWRTWLEWATHQQVGGQQRSEVHVVSSLGGLHVRSVVAVTVIVVACHSSGIDGLDAVPVRMSVAVPADRSLGLMERPMGEVAAVGVHRWLHSEGLGLAMPKARGGRH